jgi:hypothetical protein
MTKAKNLNVRRIFRRTASHIGDDVIKVQVSLLTALATSSLIALPNFLFDPAGDDPVVILGYIQTS